jgi:hypothetical protein
MQSRTTTFSLIALCALLGSILIWRAISSDAEKAQLRARVAVLSQELYADKTASAPIPAPLAQTTKTPSAPVLPAIPPPIRRDAVTIPKLNEDLAAARTRISELESKVLSLDADRATLTQQRQQELTASEESCRTRIADTQVALEKAQTDLKAAQQRATLFESENENLRKAQPSAVKAAAKTAAGAPEGELDELSRRRDTYLKSLMRRYREIDNEYRALLRDPQGTHTTDPAVFRIQGTLSQAEDDLRQIDSLTAKTLLVEKRRDKN